MDYLESLKLYKEAKTRTIKRWLRDGIEIMPLEFYRGREKESGAMFGGKAILKYKEIELHLEMWHHHNSNEMMTEEEVIENLELKGIQMNGEYYDLYWYAKRLAGKFFIFKKGWMKKPLDSEIYQNRIKDMREEYLMGATEEDANELLRIGFVRVPDLDYV